MRTITAITATGIAGLLAFTAQAQTPPTRESTPATPLSTTLGLVVFPAKNQSKDQQATDETECYAWSKQQTGIDPFAAPTATPAPAPTAAAAEQKPGGERIRGAAKGAAAGAVIGEIANDDAGEGAAIGATAGVVAGGRQKRKAEAQAQQQAAAQQQQAAAQSQQAAADQKAMFNKGFSACLEARSYTVK
jgi:YMGG-like Gly-zipper